MRRHYHPFCLARPVTCPSGIGSVWKANLGSLPDRRPTIHNRLKHCFCCAELFEITPRVRLKTPVSEPRRVIDSRP